jgi:hypothetical protein
MPATVVSRKLRLTSFNNLNMAGYVVAPAIPSIRSDLICVKALDASQYRVRAKKPAIHLVSRISANSHVVMPASQVNGATVILT